MQPYSSDKQSIPIENRLNSILDSPLNLINLETLPIFASFIIRIGDREHIQSQFICSVNWIMLNVVPFAISSQSILHRFAWIV